MANPKGINQYTSYTFREAKGLGGSSSRRQSGGPPGKAHTIKGRDPMEAGQRWIKFVGLKKARSGRK